MSLLYKLFQRGVIGLLLSTSLLQGARAAQFFTCDNSDDEVYRYNSDFSLNSNFDTAAAGADSPSDIAVVGDKVYVFDNTDKKVYRYNIDGSAGAASRTLRRGGNNNLGTVNAMTIYNDELWIADETNDVIVKFSLTTAFTGSGNYTGTNASFSVHTTASGMTSDSNYLYVYQKSNSTIYRYSRTTPGSATASRVLEKDEDPLTQVEGIAVKGMAMYAVDTNGADTVYGYNLAALFAASGTLEPNAEFEISGNNTDSKGIGISNLPWVDSINRVTASPTELASVEFIVTFSEPVTGVDAADFALATTGVSGASITSVIGSDATYTVTVSTGTGNGSVGLNFTDNDTVLNEGLVPTGGAGTGNANFTGQVYTIVRTPPTVDSINLVDSNPTTQDSLNFTVTFSESVTGVTSGNFSFAGTGVTGDISTVSGSDSTRNVLVENIAGNGTFTIHLDNNLATITDTAGNPLSSAFTSGQLYTVDNTPPTVVLSTTADDPTNVSPIVLTITFSEPVTDFTAADVDVTGASKGSLVGTGPEYTLNLTPTGQGTITASISENSCTDGVNQPNSASNEFSVVYDSEAPTVALSTGEGSPTNLAAIPVSVTLSEDSTDFDAGDITTGNATVENFDGSGSSYSFDLVPVGQGNVTASVEAGKFTDAATNGNEASNVLSLEFDSVGPTVTLATTATDPTNVSPIPVTVTLSEDTTDFDAGDVNASNATVDNFAGSGSDYTFDLIPAGEGAVTASVAAGALNDGLGNDNSVSNELSIVFDSVGPTVTLATTAADPTNVSPIPVTVTLSEDSTDFDAGDVTASNATVENFAGSGSEYTFDLTPTGEGSVSASVDAGALNDSVGNDNSASNNLSLVYDATGPLVSAVTGVDRKTVDVTFSELTGVSGDVLNPANYAISGAGQGTVAANPDSVVLLSGSTYRLTWSSGDMIKDAAIVIDVTGVADSLGNITPSNGGGVALPVSVSSFSID